MTPRIGTGALWVAAAVIAVGTGTMAVVAAATDSGDRLTQEEVSRQLAQARTGTPTPTVTATPGASPAGQPPEDTITISTGAGVIQATCDGSLVYLNSWSPKEGYRVDDVMRGLSEVASLWLESDRFDDVEIVVRCEDGTPVAESLVEPDDHGGGDDRDDDNSGPG